MRGYNTEPLLERRPTDVVPLRFNILVKLHQEIPTAKGIILPESAKELKEHTRGNVGTIIAMGERVADSQTAEGLLDVGVDIIFDESVSIDDPNRCFKWGDDVYMLFDIETVMGRLYPGGSIHLVEQLLGDRVMVKRPVKEEQKRKSGIFVPLLAVPEPIGGEVIAVGRGAFKANGDRFPMSVAVGDNVLFPKFGGTDIKLAGVDYVIIKQDKILAITKGEAHVTA
jgi:chaperonin GroES